MRSCFNRRSYKPDACPSAQTPKRLQGDIRTDMFFELVTADIVIADVSAPNVNVFYESVASERRFARVECCW